MSYDFLDLKQHGRVIFHSAKGSTWEDHKYIKKENGNYIYPNDKGGSGKSSISDLKSTMLSDLANKQLHLEDDVKSLDGFTDMLEESYGVNRNDFTKEELAQLHKDIVGSGKSEKKTTNKKLSTKEVDALAKQVIRGKFGNGKARKDALGNNYKQVQARVNAMLKKGGR